MHLFCKRFVSDVRCWAPKCNGERHGPRMIDRAQELGIPWPTLKATDLGDLVSFLNAPAGPK